MFRDLFTTYYDTDPPPIITEDYKRVRDTYNKVFLPIIQGNTNNQNNQDNITFSDYNSLSEQYNMLSNATNATNISQSSKQYNNMPTSNTFQSSKSGNQIVQYFVNKGLTLNQAKGIYGNLMQESGGNIRAVSNDGHYSFGLAQWTGNRKTKLFNKYGTNPSIINQLDFIWEELNTSEKKALNALKQTTTIEDATRVFMTKFERPNPKYANFNRRLNFAKSV